jgi:Skp family chaperone for outer membrane proteins
MLKLQRLIQEARIVGKIELQGGKKDDRGSSSGKVSHSDLKALEKVLDKLFATVGLDIEFSKHFVERLNHDRNKEQITIEELRSLFQKTYQKYAKDIVKKEVDWQAVLKDLQSKINIPFVLVWDKKNNELDLVAKTVMRKNDCKTSNPLLKV